RLLLLFASNLTSDARLDISISVKSQSLANIVFILVHAVKSGVPDRPGLLIELKYSRLGFNVKSDCDVMLLSKYSNAIKSGSIDVSIAPAKEFLKTSSLSSLVFWVQSKLVRESCPDMFIFVSSGNIAG